METRTSKNKFNDQMDKELETDSRVEKYPFSEQVYLNEIKKKYNKNPTLINEFLEKNGYYNYDISGVYNYLMITVFVELPLHYEPEQYFKHETKFEDIIDKLKTK